MEPTKEELQKIRESRLAQQSSDPFYLKESSSLTAKSPLRSNNNVISDIPVQNIELDVPLKIAGLASSDQYLEMSKNGSNSKKDKKKKKNKKHKKKDGDMEVRIFT